MTNLNNQQLVLVADYVIKRMSRLADQADTEADAITGSVGFVGTSTDAAVSGGSTSSIVERTAASRELNSVRRWEQAKVKLARALQDVDRALTDLVPAAEAEWKPAGSGKCQACNRWVSGSAADRIRSGLCEACRKWVKRTMERQRIDRGEALLARRRQLAVDTDAELGTLGTAAAH